MKRILIVIAALLLSVNAYAAPTVHRHLEPETVSYNTLVSGSNTAWFTVNSNIVAIKYRSGVTFASVVLKMSTVAPRLVTGSSVDWRPYALITGASFNINSGAAAIIFTGVSPGQGEALSGIELLSNPSFDIDTSGWGSLVQCSIASIAGGQQNNCLELTKVSGSLQSTGSDITTTIGKLVKISVYAKSGSSGNEPFTLRLRDAISTGINVDTTSTTTGSWVKLSGYATAVYTSLRFTLQKNSATTGTMLFDTASAQQVIKADLTGFDATGSTDGGVVPNAASFVVTITRP